MLFLCRIELKYLNNSVYIDQNFQLSYFDIFVLVFFNNMGAHLMYRLAYLLADKRVKISFTKAMKIRLNNFDTAIYKNFHVFAITRALNSPPSSTKRFYFRILEFEYLVQCCTNVLSACLSTLKIVSSVK